MSERNPPDTLSRIKSELLRRERPSNVRWMAVICLAAALVSFYSWAVELNPDRDTTRSLIASALILATAGLYWQFARHFRVWMLMVAILVGFTTGLLALTTSSQTGVVLTVTTLLWTCVLIGTVYDPPVARGFALYVGVGLGPALAFNGIDQAVALWLALALSFAVTIEILARTTGRLRSEATTDPLTGLPNRKGFDEAGRRTRAACIRSDTPLSVVQIDLDDFKLVNDSMGHRAGDRMLNLCVEAWLQGIRGGDTLARTGGDEFALLLPGTERDQAEGLMVRLAENSPLTWSAGVAQLGPGDTIESALARADAEMYRCKERKAAPPVALA